LIDLDNQTNLKFDITVLENIALKLTQKDIELLIVDNKTIQKINKEFRKKDKPTDVLSFPLQTKFSQTLLGSIIISSDFVKQKAKEYGHSQNEELSLLFIHALLHLLGYDHETDDGKHRQKEEELIEEFNLPNSLIVRNS